MFGRERDEPADGLAVRTLATGLVLFLVGFGLYPASYCLVAGPRAVASLLLFAIGGIVVGLSNIYGVFASILFLVQSSSSTRRRVQPLMAWLVLVLLQAVTIPIGVHAGGLLEEKLRGLPVLRALVRSLVW